MSSSQTFPIINDPRPMNHFIEEGELIEEKEMVSLSFYDCPDDVAFLKLLEVESLPQLEERFEWLKLKFRIVNAKCFNRETERGSFSNILFSDIRFYPCLLSWHFEDCPSVNFSTTMRRRRRNNEEEEESNPLFPNCQCEFGLKDPDLKVKRNARELKIDDKWCMDGTLLSLIRIKNEHFAMYRSGLKDRVIRDRYFGYGFNSGDETQFSEEMRCWTLRRLRLMRNHIASRLRLVNYMKTVKKYHLPLDFYGLKTTNGNWHVNCCHKTNYDQICECSLAFDHPKGWFRYFGNVTNIGTTGYALIQKPIFRDIIN